MLKDDLINENDFDIFIFKDKIFFRIIITADISIQSYSSRMNLVDVDGVSKLLGMSILWNSAKQKVNKGVYYVGAINDRFYNILINDEFLEIDESVKCGDITEERNIILNLLNNDYSYNKFKHSKNGSTFYTKYYPFDLIPELSLTKEEAFYDISDVINKLELIEGIGNIVDMKLLKKSIF